jgi:hypothetical protein
MEVEGVAGSVDALWVIEKETKMIFKFDEETKLF